MFKVLLMGACMLIAAPALACDPGGKTVVNCKTKSGKTLEVCQLGASLQYKFGRSIVSPEMEIKVLNEEMRYVLSFGSGMENAYLIFPKAKMSYIVNLEKVFDDLKTRSTEEAFRAYVEVRQADKLVATVQCDEARPIYDGRSNIKPQWISYERAMELGVSL